MGNEILDIVDQVIGTLPPETSAGITTLIKILQAVGIFFLIYLIFLISNIIINIKRYKIIIKIHKKVNKINEKLDEVLNKKLDKKEHKKKSK